MCEAPANQRCRFCRWFYMEDDSPLIGVCRRKAPTFPAVKPADWCGEFEQCPEYNSTTTAEA